MSSTTNTQDFAPSVTIELEGSAKDQVAAAEIQALADTFRASSFSSYSADAYSDAVNRAKLSPRANEVAVGLGMRVFYRGPVAVNWSGAHLADKLHASAYRLERNKNWCLPA